MNMDKLKRILCVLLSLCIIIGFASCKKDNPDGNVKDNPSTTQTSNENTKDEIKFLSLNKEYISHYEWYEDTSTMLVRSEYSDVTLDKSMEKQYPLLAKTLAETSAMRKRAMEDEKDNYIAFATEDFKKDSENFSTYVSALDVQVRRADSIAVSILEDYSTKDSRSFNGINYDTESGKELRLADVLTDTSQIPTVVEKEIMSRIGEDDESAGDTAVVEYFKNTPEDSITWTLDYNGVTFYFNSGDIAPTNFGIQVVTVTFAEYSDLFNEKYTVVPDEYVVSLPVSAPFYSDAVGNNETDEIIVSGDYDDNTKFYHTISVNSETSEYEIEWFSYVEPYYVRTADGKSYVCVFSVNNEEEGKNFTLSVYELKNDKAKLLSTSKTGLDCIDENIFALPTTPSELLSIG